ncbi:MAG: pallilysin-related adhesin [Breznakiellaceae bacterium]
MKHFRGTSVIVVFFAFTAVLVVFFALTGSEKEISGPSPSQTGKVITPRIDSEKFLSATTVDTEQLAFEDSNSVKIALSPTEAPISVLTQDFDGDPSEEQLVAYRKNGDAENRVYLMYIDFNETNGNYEKIWSSPTIITRPQTLRLFTKDLLGDRSICAILTGLNDRGEQTITVFHKKEKNSPIPFSKIAELAVDGSILIKESERTEAYEMGLTRAPSFPISTLSRDLESSNILDQIEVIYNWDPSSGQYVRVGTNRIERKSVVQRQLRNLVDGTPGKVEAFLQGLWYSVQSTTGGQRSIYFDPERREIIFYFEGTQEVYSWTNSSPTRYGLYITCQNISITTLKRFIDVNLENGDTITLRIYEDVKIKIGVADSWDGIYQKMTGADRKISQHEEAAPQPLSPWVSEKYEGNEGSLHFNADGTFLWPQGKEIQEGKYLFFQYGSTELLELHPKTGSSPRVVYQVERQKEGKTGTILVLSRVQLSSKGIQTMNLVPLRLRKIEQ